MLSHSQTPLLVLALLYHQFVLPALKVVLPLPKTNLNPVRLVLCLYPLSKRSQISLALQALFLLA